MSMNGAELLPFLEHYWDSAGAIKLPALNAGSELSDTVQEFPFAKLNTSGKEVFIGENEGDHWFRLCLNNPSNEPHSLVVAFEPPTLSEIDFYPQKRGLASFQTGRTKKLSTRDIPNPQFDFNVRLLPNEKQVFYIRAYSDTNPYLLANLWDRSSYDAENNLKETSFGIFVGVMLGLVIYNLLLFVSVRQWSSLIYIAWNISVFMLLASIDGRLVQYLTPDYPHFSRIATTIFYPLSIFLSALFCQEFIKLKSYPKLNHAGKLLQVVSLIALPSAYLYDIAFYFRTCAALGLIFALYFGLLVPVYIFVKDRLVAAKYILMISATIIVCAVDRFFFVLGITSQDYVPLSADSALVIAMILVSYFIGLMAYREKQAAQRAALEQLNISNSLKSSYNTQLEEELEQKTADIRSMNENLEQQAQKLLQLDESKSRFFANISHEFRTPLTLIEGPLTMLLERESFPEKQTLRGVIRNSNALKHLIDQILMLSELDENSLGLKASKVDVVEAVNEFAAQFTSMVEQKGVSLICEASQPVIHAYVDYEKLQIVINNLLSNAIKFTEAPGQISIKLSCSAADCGQKDEYSRDEYIHIEVADTGQGIPDNELAYVFDRYFQSDSSELSKSGLGTGIGLALVKELVDLHAGDVTVKSVYEPDDNITQTGTSFCVTLPLGRAHLSDQELIENFNATTNGINISLPNGTDEEESHELVSDSQGYRPTVLVVDDNKDMRRHIRRVLEGHFRIITAQDGLLAEEVLNEQIPDLIVTDLMMPNRNGLEFVESIKKHDEFARIPVIMLTARAGLDDKIKGLVAAVDDYLVKPFSGHELKVRIKNLLNKHAQFSAFYQDQVSGLGSKHSNQTKTYIDKVKLVVNQRLSDRDFGVEELAKALHVSEATLRRRLSENAKFTPAAFIRHCRLERARGLLLQGNMRSVSELANAVGFSQPSYFARLYEKTFNCELDIHTQPKKSQPKKSL